MKTISFVLLLSVFSLVSYSQTKPVYAWISGSWIGDGFGGVSEEIWSEPSADGTIIGCFRHTNKDGSPNFYEFWVLDNAGLRLKHFNPDMTGWEEKEDFVTFEMIEVTEVKIVLKGLIYERISDTEMKISLKLKDDEGNVSTEVFQMKRR